MNLLNSHTKIPPLNTALLFIVFNRPNTTAKVFNEIRKARPERLYIASDGPREHLIDELQKINCVRKIVTDVDWKCEVRTLFSEKNLGCKEACGKAINWFFEKEEEGIILEDDCLPHPDFFYFCEILLNYYRHEKKIFQITGSNFQNNIKRGKASYYFSNYNHLWGWATWKRVWDRFDPSASQWSGDGRELLSEIETLTLDQKRYWAFNLDRVTRNQDHEIWDYQFTFSQWANNRVALIPRNSLVKNIGFTLTATHTKEPGHWLSEVDAHEMVFPLKHPFDLRPLRELDGALGSKLFSLGIIRFLFLTLATKIFSKTQLQSLL
jgi:hypothetical protein